MPNIAKYIFGGCFFVWILAMASCGMMGAGSIMMIDGLSRSETAQKIARKHREYELNEHNERANREASVHERDDYQADYYENYEN
ncbi:hypothetical protein OLX02_00950 [Novosphingobium sp. KCTC 2891]|uniref:hypothetical protein n=1 Tax=Novosphingobium sp. KCTC 2891 TaxID=2989730 RepID=UPI0022227B2B|nr:hypothetical protein [Novosphingobium sp. KCTC 2891]MCW1381379.1 hypothetical protein [Novosphingobium sp. KCTC 2891]